MQSGEMVCESWESLVDDVLAEGALVKRRFAARDLWRGERERLSQVSCGRIIRRLCVGSVEVIAGIFVVVVDVSFVVVVAVAVVAVAVANVVVSVEKVVVIIVVVV